jgi:uncharacterized tellurite resistance protein B-like protein
MDDAAHVSSFADVFRSTQNKQSVCILALLTWVAGCDGQIKPREQALLDQIAQAIDDAAELASVEAAMRQPSAADLELACRHLKNNLDRISRKLLAQLAVTIVTADGHLTVGENLLLQFLSDLLGLSPRQFARLFEQIAHRPFPLPGDVSSIEWWRQRESGRPSVPSDVISSAGQDDATAADEPMTRATALRVLGLENQASPDAVHKAYRKLARTRHPDRFAPLGAAAVATASEAFKRLHEAYQLLSAPQLR